MKGIKWLVILCGLLAIVDGWLTHDSWLLIFGVVAMFALFFFDYSTIIAILVIGFIVVSLWFSVHH